MVGNQLFSVRSQMFLGVLLAIGPSFWGMADSWDYQRIVEYAASKAPEVTEADARVQAAEAKLAQAWAAYSPVIQIQYGYSRTDSPINSFGNILNQESFSQGVDFNRVPTTDNFGARGVASLSLYSGGRDSAKIEAARQMVSGVKLGRAATTKRFALSAAVAALEVKRAVAVVNAARSTVQAFEASERSILGRVSAGSAVRTELLDIQVQLERAREGLVRAENGHELAVESLASLLAVDGSQFTPVLGEILVAEPTDMVNTRDEVAAAEALRLSAHSEAQGAFAGYLPRISVQATYEQNRGQILDGDSDSYTVGIIGEWTIWDGLMTANQRREAQANLLAASAAEQRARARVDLEMRTAQIRLKESRDAYEIAVRAEALARESAKLTRARFSQGLATSTQLIDSEHALTTADVNLASSDVDRKIALLTLRRAYNLGPLEKVFGNENMHKNE